ncbi:hypothetical protein DPMN_162624 [Dreissena polymorpha]|uniref:WSC domain-containing protein n=1 Tax=Dreissena polymorpha TaxID=45954 RepID=A0A9D4EUG3_DREPO|nr:hypothetical protein DPMN_162624 [Dreissena polymorpha]
MLGYRTIGNLVSLLLGIRVEGIVYLGCYKDSTIERVLSSTQSVSASNTPVQCARRCSDYRYAGVEFVTECFCGNTLNAIAMPEYNCMLHCPGDKLKRCGGYSMISIYTNWACGPPPTIANGNATLRKGDNVTYGSIADFYCGSGLIRKATITCLSNSSWEQATCEPPGQTLDICVTFIADIVLYAWNDI